MATQGTLTALMLVQFKPLLPIEVERAKKATKRT